MLVEVKFRPGEFLFLEGDLTTEFYLIQSGQVEISVSHEDGSKIPLAVVGAGQPVGEFAMLLGEARTATAQALTQVVALCVPEEAYQKMLTELPEWATSIMTALVKRLKGMDEMIRKNRIVDESLQEEIEAIRRRALKLE